MPLFWFVSALVFLINSIILVNSHSPKYAENANSCIDSCSGYFQSKYKLDLDRGSYEAADSELVELLEDFHSSESNECSKNVLLRIPFYKLSNGTIARIEFEYGDLPKGITFHIGNSPTNDLNGGDRNTTMYNSEIYVNETNMDYFMSSLHLCDQGVSIDDRSMDLSKLLLINETSSYIYPKTKIVLYVTENWFRVDNLERGTTLYYNNKYLFMFTKPTEVNPKCETSSLNQPPYNRPSPYLYIGLNRMIADRSFTGSGLCSAEISFLNCFASPQPDLDVDVDQMDFKQRDRENIAWLSHLSFLEPSMEHSPCSGQGVIKLKFDPKSPKKVARFDLTFGDMLSGFTFNIGDSPTNNAYGGDSGSTSNSAEIHSNDNRFYVWLNTKYCGDTLLYKIEYNLFQSGDEFTLFVSDQRLEISNSKSNSGDRAYHEIFKSPYLFNLNSQNVTCNCFDTRCYPGVQPDEELYFGINRVIGGTYRPGIGLCRARITWLQCSGGENIRRNETEIIDMDMAVEWKHTARLLKSESILELEEKNSTSNSTKSNQPVPMKASLSTTAATSHTSTASEATKSLLLTTLLLSNTNSTNSTDMTSSEATNTTTNSNNETMSETEENTEADEDMYYLTSAQQQRTNGVYNKGQPLLIKVSNECNEENMKNDLIYHEYVEDPTRFIFCEGLNRPRVLKCPFNMKWSQAYQQCLLES